MGMNMIEKILAAHSGQAVVKPGEFITCDVDISLLNDLMFQVEESYFKLKKIKDPSRLVLALDHVVPAVTTKDADAMVGIRKFVEKFNIEKFYDIGRHGVAHQVLAEEGYALPGTLVACSDSHTCAAGAFNCCARGLGAVEMLHVVCKGTTWYEVGPTIRYNFEGTLPVNVSGKDVFLYLAEKYGDAAKKNIEFNGPGLASLSIADRQCIATSCAEVSAEFVVFASDQLLLDHMSKIAKGSFTPVESDPDAEYEDVRTIHLDEMVPYVSLPHFIPNNCRPVTQLAGTKINQALIGSCANGRIEDIAVAAEILKGKTIHPSVRMIVTPASQAIYLEAVQKGYVETLTQAGAVITNSSCGACIGLHMGLLGAGERCLSSTTRNFKGRMGSTDSEVLLASPATIAASALTGVITDPRTIYHS